MKTIKVCGTTSPALVDDEDYPVLSRLAWRVDKKTGQPATHIWGDKAFAMRMNRLLKPYKVNQKLDYKDGNPLNNQKDNLIYTDTTHLLQAAPKRKGCASQYKGVTYDPRRKGNKWYAHIAKDRKKYFLGYHATEVEAALAYNEAAQKLYGKDAFLNEIKQSTLTSNQAEDDSK